LQVWGYRGKAGAGSDLSMVILETWIAVCDSFCRFVPVQGANGITRL